MDVVFQARLGEIPPRSTQGDDHTYIKEFGATDEIRSAGPEKNLQPGRGACA
jgi:hypothetical protein